MSDESLWIFGYGSLVWRPAFSHLRSRPAYIEGYARRFWQGSTDHRGMPGRPGRVVTLLADSHQSVSAESGFQPTRCWGTAYEVPVSDPDGVLSSLDHRERGGYDRVELELFLGNDATRPSREFDRRSRAIQDSGLRSGEAVSGLVYVAGPENENYLGPASIESIAKQVVSASGPSGANPEYVFELARSLREMGAEDAHVSEVAGAVHALLPRSNGEINE
jgi:cation transport protein ChaC